MCRAPGAPRCAGLREVGRCVRKARVALLRERALAAEFGVEGAGRGGSIHMCRNCCSATEEGRAKHAP